MARFNQLTPLPFKGLICVQRNTNESAYNDSRRVGSVDGDRLDEQFAELSGQLLETGRRLVMHTCNSDVTVASASAAAAADR